MCFGITVSVLTIVKVNLFWWFTVSRSSEGMVVLRSCL